MSEPLENAVCHVHLGLGPGGRRPEEGVMLELSVEDWRQSNVWEERGGERFQVEGQHPLTVKDLKKPGALGATASSSMTGAAGAGWAGGKWGCSVEWLNV